jgi:type II secretory ATPase GspE/PulE/Tfp pilus assembly ATPase PilB-like protein
MVLSLLSQAVPVGGYVSWWKVIPVIIVLLLWGRMVTWIDKDSAEILLPRVPLNTANLFGAVFAFFLFFMLPSYPIALTALVLIIGAELGVYLGMRNSKVGLGDLSQKFNDWLHSLKGGEKEIKVVQGEVQLIGRNGNLMAAPATDDPILPAFEAVQTLLTDPLRRNAERIDLAPVDGSSVVKYVVDGVSYSGSTIERSRAAAAIEYIKSLAGMDVHEKRKPQNGAMKLSIDGQKRELAILTAGSTAGEQLRATVDPKKRHQQKLDDLDMPDDQVDLVRALIQENSGIVLVSSPKGHGLTTMLYAILRAHDAFLQHIHTIEGDQAADLEGITQNKIPANPAPGEEAKTVGWVVSQEPEVVMMSNVTDPKSALTLAKFASEGRRVYIGIRAGSTFEALAAWRKLIGDEATAVRDLRMIITGRVLRKLCSACKAGYTPDPTTLKKLNMDSEKVGRLYQARTQPLRDAKGNPVLCDHCKELYFKGRIGVYEMFLIDDDVRQVVEAGGSLNQLKAVFRKQRGKYLQEAALAQVEAGETSVQEVLRVMKADDNKPSSSGGGRSPRQPAV